MSVNADMKSFLDPRGVNVLKKKLIAGEISPKLFKEVLKRQMLKQYYQRHSRSMGALMKSLFRNLAKIVQQRRDARQDNRQAQPTLDMDEMFGMVRSRRLH